jgi:hypothetical protein
LAIFPSTSLRRARASPGLRIGLYSEGACGRPASSAACGRVSFQTGFEKKIFEAAWTPTAVLPSTVP